MTRLPDALAGEFNVTEQKGHDPSKAVDVDRSGHFTFFPVPSNTL